MSQQYQMFLPNKIKKGQNFQLNHEFFKSPQQRNNIKVVSQTLQEEHESYLGIKQNKNSSRLSSQQSHFQISRNSIPIIKSLQNDIAQENTNPNSKLSSSQSTRFLQDLQQHLRIQSPPTYLSLKPRKLEIYNNNLRGGSKLFTNSTKNNYQAKEELISQAGFLKKPYAKGSQKKQTEVDEKIFTKQLQDQQKNFMQVQSLNSLIQSKLDIKLDKNNFQRQEKPQNIQKLGLNSQNQNIKNKRMIFTSIPSASLNYSPIKEDNSRLQDSIECSPLLKVVNPVKNILIKQKVEQNINLDLAYSYRSQTGQPEQQSPQNVKYQGQFTSNKKSLQDSKFGQTFKHAVQELKFDQNNQNDYNSLNQSKKIPVINSQLRYEKLKIQFARNQQKLKQSQDEVVIKDMQMIGSKLEQKKDYLLIPQKQQSQINSNSDITESQQEMTLTHKNQDYGKGEMGGSFIVLHATNQEYIGKHKRNQSERKKQLSNNMKAGSSSKLTAW
eukprot:403335074